MKVIRNNVTHLEDIKVISPIMILKLTIGGMNQSHSVVPPLIDHIGMNTMNGSHVKMNTKVNHLRFTKWCTIT